MTGSLGILTGGHIFARRVPDLPNPSSPALLQKQWGSLQEDPISPNLTCCLQILWVLRYISETGEFVIKKYLIFANLILADEINRAPAKVRPHCLAMQEGQVTIGEETYELESVYCIATQILWSSRAISAAGSPADRFMLKLKVGYPHAGERRRSLSALPAVLRKSRR